MRIHFLEHSGGFYFGCAFFLIIVCAVVFWLRRRPKDPSEIEQQRRSYLSRVGRIIEGEVVEIVEQAAPPAAKRQRRAFRCAAPAAPPLQRQQTLVFYSYCISGVSYESAQDVSGLEERACIRRIVQGQPASVKYDPANPANSILVSEGWSGLQ